MLNGPRRRPSAHARVGTKVRNTATTNLLPPTPVLALLFQSVCGSPQVLLVLPIPAFLLFYLSCYARVVTPRAPPAGAGAAPGARRHADDVADCVVVALAVALPLGLGVGHARVGLAVAHAQRVARVTVRVCLTDGEWQRDDGLDRLAIALGKRVAVTRAVADSVTHAWFERDGVGLALGVALSLPLGVAFETAISVAGLRARHGPDARW